MKKIIFVMVVILLLSFGLAGAVTQQEINEAKKLIDSKADCKSLSNSQLEIMGEYYMEQMHPGESHELMHQMMGLKEGSEDEEQFHINMAKAIYCGEGNVMSSGMMDMMMGRGGMMNFGGVKNMANYGMMGNYGMMSFSYWNFINVLYIILLIGLIILVFLFIIRLWKKIKK